MTLQANTVKQYLNQIGAIITSPWSPIESFQPPTEFAGTSWNGVNMIVTINEQLVQGFFNLGLIPNSAVAAFYRRLLISPSICKSQIADESNLVSFCYGLPTIDLTAAQLRWMLDTLSSSYYQFGGPYRQKFSYRKYHRRVTSTIYPTRCWFNIGSRKNQESQRNWGSRVSSPTLEKVLPEILWSLRATRNVIRKDTLNYIWDL